MIQTVFKRQEIKFLLDRDQRARLERAMRGHVVPDAYGPSTVCNVYYDTPTLLLARRSADHPAYKEKLRTRSYGVSDGTEPVFVELKKKYDGVVYKRRATLPPADADALLSGRREGATQIERELAFAAGRYEGLAPRAFVAYDREAFFAPDDHEFRMTFDRRVRARWERLSLCDGDDGDALLDEDVSILEVKCLEGMPLWLVRHLSAEGIRKASWSKYVSACRARLAQGAGALSRAAVGVAAPVAPAGAVARTNVGTARAGALPARG